MIKTTLLVILGLSSIAIADDGPTPAVVRRFSKFDTIVDDAVRDATKTRQQDPLKFISSDMKSVAGDLSQYQTGQLVQKKEDEVVSQLDVVIKQLTAQCKGSSGASLNPMRPMADSKLGGGPGGIHELTDPKASDKQWGNLSPKQRDQILQSKTDGFPAGYESLLQSYYKRLAQEQVSGDDKSSAATASASNAPTNAPTTAPSK